MKEGTNTKEKILYEVRVTDTPHLCGIFRRSIKFEHAGNIMYELDIMIDLSEAVPVSKLDKELSAPGNPGLTRYFTRDKNKALEFYKEALAVKKGRLKFKIKQFENNFEFYSKKINESKKEINQWYC